MTHKSTALLTGVMLLAATSVMPEGGDLGNDLSYRGGSGGIFIDNTPLTLKKGITTQAEVTEVLGDPDTVSADPAGGVIWTYLMDATVLISEDRTSFVITPSQTSKRTLILVFDASKKLIEFKTPPSGAI
jgi:outer membrane protein assembly factor BamE (lipoprotein component of BamABCDE complex)